MSTPIVRVNPAKHISDGLPGGGHNGIVRLLLGRKDVNPDIPEARHGQTSISRAAENGHEGVVKLLLGRKDVQVHPAEHVGSFEAPGSRFQS